MSLSLKFIFYLASILEVKHTCCMRVVDAWRKAGKRHLRSWIMRRYYTEDLEQWSSTSQVPQRCKHSWRNWAKQHYIQKSSLFKQKLDQTIYNQPFELCKDSVNVEVGPLSGRVVAEPVESPTEGKMICFHLDIFQWIIANQFLDGIVNCG